MPTMPIRVEGDLFDAAQSAGVRSSRSAAQQLSHWARIGRAFESARGVSLRAVDAVLSGDVSYDTLSDAEQAVVRGTWDEQVNECLCGLDLAAEFEADGEPWVEASADGTTVSRS